MDAKKIESKDQREPMEEVALVMPIIFGLTLLFALVLYFWVYWEGKLLSLGTLEAVVLAFLRCSPFIMLREYLLGNNCFWRGYWKEKTNN